MVRAALLAALTPASGIAAVGITNSQHSWIPAWVVPVGVIAAVIVLVKKLDSRSKRKATMPRPDPDTYPNTPTENLAGENGKTTDSGEARLTWKQRIAKRLPDFKLSADISEWLGSIFALLATAWILTKLGPWVLQSFSLGGFKWVGNVIIAVFVLLLTGQYFYYLTAKEKRYGWVLGGALVLAFIMGSPPHFSFRKPPQTLESANLDAAQPVVPSITPDSAELERHSVHITVGPSPARTTLASNAGVILVEPGQSIWVRAEGKILLGRGEYLHDLQNVNRTARDLNLTSVEVTPAGGQVMTTWGFPRISPDHFALYGAPAGIPLVQFGGNGNATWVTERWQQITYHGGSETTVVAQLNLPRQGKLFGTIPKFWENFQHWEIEPIGTYTLHVALGPLTPSKHSG